jgi:hypothetical protein
MKMKSTFLVLCLTIANANVNAQVTTDVLSLSVAVNHEDAKAIGMGKTQFANGTQFNAMLYNPALLTHERFSFELLGVQASLPSKSISAVSFLADNANQFKRDGFIAKINAGARAFKNATNDDERLAALQTLQKGLRFVSELQDKVGGPANDPKIHGIGVVPSLAGQFGNWGVALYGSAQTAFTLLSSDAVTELAKVPIPRTSTELNEETIAQLLNATGALLNADGTIRDDAVPAALAVSYADIVAAAGYAHQVNAALSIGVNVKLVNRHFSSRAIDPGNYNKILSELRSDFNNSVTGVTLDLGGMYRLSRTGTQVGVSIQNVIPVKKVESSMRFTNYTTNESGAIVPVRVTIPFELKLPILVNAGVFHSITESWDASMDVADIASQDDKFEDYLARVRVGTEYRLSTGKNGFGVALRGGLAEKNVTFGLGLNFGNVVQLDGAYAHDTYVDENAWFAQIKFGW